MRFPRFRHGILLLAGGAIWAQGVQGQLGTTMGGGPGSIQGKIKDESGAVKPGASVELTDKAGNKHVENADQKGVFTFKDLKPDQYVVETQSGTKPEIDPSTTNFRYTAPVDRYVFFDGGGGIVPVAGERGGQPPRSDPGRGSPSTTRQTDSASDDTLTASTESDVRKWLDSKASNHLAATAVVGTSDGKSVVHFTRTDANTIPTYVVILFTTATLSEGMQKVTDISGSARFLGIHRIDEGHWLLIFKHERQ
jgi:hypothetical protein